MLKKWALVLASALTLVLAACSSNGANSSANGSMSGDGVGSPVTLGLTFIPNVQFAPAYVAQTDGIFSSAGLDVTLRHHGSDEGLFTALASGQEDVVIASGDEVLPARQAGVDLVSIGAFYHSYPVTIIVPANSGISSFEDLKGKKIGIPGEYGSSWYGLLAGLQAHHMTTDDISVVSIGYTQQAALAAGQVDAVVGFSNNDLVMDQQAGLDVSTIELTPADTPLVSAAIVTTHTWLAAHPQEATALVQSITAASSRVIANPQHALEVTQKYDHTLSDAHSLATAREVLKRTITLLTQDGKATGVQDLEKWKQMAAFQRQIPDVLNTDADVDAAVTNDYAQ